MISRGGTGTGKKDVADCAGEYSSNSRVVSEEDEWYGLVEKENDGVRKFL